MWRKIAFWMLFALLITLSFQTASAQTNLSWTTQLFDNAYLVGSPVLTRTDSAVAFDWGSGVPAPGLPADNFSARFSTDAYFAAGSYRFWVLADDGVKLWVDFQCVIDTYDSARPGQTLSADVTLTAGIKHIQIDYRENVGNAYLYVTWANLAAQPAGPSFPQPQPVTYTPAGMWTAQYFGNAALSGYPALIQSESLPLNRNWGSGSPMPIIPADSFSARWSGQFWFNAGYHQATAQADDGVRLWVDTWLWIDQWHSASGLVYSTVQYLSAGIHTITVEYYEASGLAFITAAVTPTAAPQPTQPTQPPIVAAATAQVTAGVLNLRESPNCDCSVLTRVRAGEVYPIVGRNADSSWYQIYANGMMGWVYGRFVTPYNVANVPVTDSSSAPQYVPTGYIGTARLTLSIRAHPGNTYAYLGRVPRGAVAVIVGRNSAGTWWQITYDGVTGWVNGYGLAVTPSVDLSRVPLAW